MTCAFHIYVSAAVFTDVTVGEKQNAIAMHHSSSAASAYL